MKIGVTVTNVSRTRLRTAIILVKDWYGIWIGIRDRLVLVMQRRGVRRYPGLMIGV
jgi:hypothetical protein